MTIKYCGDLRRRRICAQTFLSSSDADGRKPQVETFLSSSDANNDNKITARELHAYVEQNVVQQSSGSQTPELQGDKERVLVQFN